VRSSRAPVDHLLAWRAGCEAGTQKILTPLTPVRSERIRQYSTYDCVLAIDSYDSIGRQKWGVTSSVADPLEAAGQTILGLVHRAASTAEKNYQQALDFTQKLSGQLKAAEDRIKALEADVRYQVDRADRAEKWLYKISVEIEQRFFGGDDSRRVQVPASQAQSHRR
jgi:hypothetical protein